MTGQECGASVVLRRGVSIAVAHAHSHVPHWLLRSRRALSRCGCWLTSLTHGKKKKSRVTLGTLSAPRFGGPQRARREGGYAPVPGPRGDNARAADALSLRLIIHLHHWAATGP